MHIPRIEKVAISLLATQLLAITVLQGGEKAPELEGTAEAFSEAWSSGGAEALGAQYTEDALLFPPNTPLIKGREAIAEFFEAGKTPGATLWLKDAESSVTGDNAFKWGHYKVKIADGTVVDKGRYMETRKKVDGAWLIDRDIYSSALPPVAEGMSATAAAIEGFVAVWNNNQVDDLDAILTQDFVRNAATGNVEGIAGIKGIIAGFHTSFPDVAVKLHETQYFNGGAVLHWNFKGTNTGPGENPPTGKAVDIDGFTILKMKDGKIASESLQFDTLSWQQQLGYTLQGAEE